MLQDMYAIASRMRLYPEQRMYASLWMHSLPLLLQCVCFRLKPFCDFVCDELFWISARFVNSRMVLCVRYSWTNPRAFRQPRSGRLCIRTGYLSLLDQVGTGWARCRRVWRCHKRLADNLSKVGIWAGDSWFPRNSPAINDHFMYK